MERVFRRDWVAVCTESALAKSGDCLALDIGVSRLRWSEARMVSCALFPMFAGIAAHCYWSEGLGGWRESG